MTAENMYRENPALLLCPDCGRREMTPASSPSFLYCAHCYSLGAGFGAALYHHEYLIGFLRDQGPFERDAIAS